MRFAFNIIPVLLLASLNCHANDFYSGPDFTATKVSVDGRDKQVSQIFMSKKGFREELLSNVPVKLIYISNYRQKKTWMVVPSKKLVSDMATLPGHDQGTFDQSTLFDNQSCKGFDRTKKMAVKNIKNESIEEWGCINTQSRKAILQWFNPKTKMVIREKDKTTGQEDITVSNVKFSKQPGSLFELPTGYKNISMTEMMKIMQQ